MLAAGIEAERVRLTSASLLMAAVMRKDAVAAAAPQSAWHEQSSRAVLHALNATREGLTQAEAQARLRAHGVEFDSNWGQTNESDGREYQVGITAGTSFAKGRGKVVANVAYADRESVLAGQRKFSNTVLGYGGPEVGFTSQGSPTIVEGAVTVAASQAAVDQVFGRYGVPAGAEVVECSHSMATVHFCFSELLVLSTDTRAGFGPPVDRTTDTSTSVSFFTEYFIENGAHLYFEARPTVGSHLMTGYTIKRTKKTKKPSGGVLGMRMR